MPAKFAWDAAKMSFLYKLTLSPDSTAGFLYRAGGREEWIQLADAYSITVPTTPASIKKKVWDKFKAEIQL